MVVKIKTGFSRLSDNDLSAEAWTIIDQMTTNSADYPTPAPTLAVLTTASSDFDAAKAFRGGPAQTAAKNLLRKDLIALMNTEALYVQRVCGNDLAKALRSGFNVWSGRNPVGVLPAPSNFELKLGKNTGWIEARMKSYGRKAKAYVYRYSYDNATDPSTWTVVYSTSARKVITGLASLKTVYVQGAGVGANPTQVWSTTRSIGVM